MKLTTPAGEEFEVYITGPENAKRGILIIHDWWGLLPYNRDCADHFAKLGYRALVIDLYDGYHPPDTKTAGEYMRAIDQDVANRKMTTALQELGAPKRKLAVLGWSFGGLQAQHVSLLHPDWIQAIVLYYCRIVYDKNNATALKAPVFAVFAETERTWPDKQAELEHVMAELDKPLECHSYDSDHGFVNPDSLRYDAESTEDARRVTLAFLKRHMD
jgi:carboxymethylenebutenolidase